MCLQKAAVAGFSRSDNLPGVSALDEYVGKCGGVSMTGSRRDVLELNIQSSYAAMERVTALVETVAERVGISEDDTVDLMIAVTEAVTNAIQHGNREDGNKHIHIRIEAVPSKVTVWVEDEGEGFDASSVPDPRNSSNLMEKSGRGILMMKAFMDRVEFTSGKHGTRVKMVKRFFPTDRKTQIS